MSIENIHGLSCEDIGKMSIDDRILSVIEGLKHQEIKYIGRGYRYGKEITYADFCIQFNRLELNVFKSSHDGYIAPDYLELNRDSNGFKLISKEIKRTILEYFEF